MDTLHDSCRQDPEAFGITQVALQAGDRLTDALQILGSLGPERLDGNGSAVFMDERDQLLAALAGAVAGNGGTIADVVVRRAVVAAGREVLDDPRVCAGTDEGAAGTGAWSGELLCLLYQLFFKHLVVELLSTFIAEKLRLAVPVLILADPERKLGHWIGERIAELVPDPCEEAAKAVGAATTVLARDPADPVPMPTVVDAARRLVPGTVASILGLAAEAWQEANA